MQSGCPFPFAEDPTASLSVSAQPPPTTGVIPSKDGTQPYGCAVGPIHPAFP